MNIGAARVRSLRHDALEAGNLATRSVGLLAVIESTVDSLVSNTEMLQLLSRQAWRLAEQLRQRDNESVIDPDGKIAAALQATSAGLRQRRERALQQCESARRDPELRADDGVVDAYLAFIDALADCHNALEEARDVVETLDALRSPRHPGVFSNVEDLLHALRS